MGRALFWWGLAGLVATIVGALGPWAEILGVTVDGIHDEVVLILASVSGAALLASAGWRRTALATLSMLGALGCCVAILHALADRHVLAGGPTDGFAVHPEWGIWLALAGSVSVVIASGAIVAGTARAGGVAPFPYGSRRAAKARSRAHQADRAPAQDASARGATRELFWERAKSMTPYVAVEQRGDVFLLPTSIDSKLFVRADRSEFAVLDRACAVLRRAGRLRENGAIVDVGAHIGTTTIHGLIQQGFERAVAIEPDPDHVPLLRANIALNGLDERVTVIAAGASDCARQRAFEPGTKGRDRRRWMKGRLVEEPSGTAITVETVTLDDLADADVVDPEHTGLLWFDCSRCEEAALRSADAFLARRVPIVFTLRKETLRESSPLLRRLRDTYEYAVDLRYPTLADPAETWAPTVLRIEELPALHLRRKLTDMLVY